MNETIHELMQAFYDAVLPRPKPRKITIPERERNATVITGMRRTGKTFLVFQRIRELLDAGVPLNRILYINFEDERLTGFSVKDFRLIPDLFYQRCPENSHERCYFFFDEIQNIPEWEKFVRRLVDTGRIQVYLTGSSSKLLTADIATSMRGRSVETEVFPLSFAEFIEFHGIAEKIPTVMAGAFKAKMRHALDEYFRIGGFPEVQNGLEPQWTATLQGYARSVMLNDVVERHGVQNIAALKYIMKRIFHNPAQRISVNKICDELRALEIRADRNYIRSYLDHFCEAYIFYAVPYHTDSMAKRRMNPEKYYAADIGLVRAMSSKQSQDRGHLLENLVFLHLRRQGYTIEYLITRSGYEIDFVVFHPIQREYKIIQSCYTLASPATMEREVRALKDAAQYLKSKECIIVTWNEEAEMEGGIRAIPAWKFLLSS